MPPKNYNLKELIHNYLSSERLIKEEIKDPKIEFGFLIHFPPGSAGRPMTLHKSVNESFILITMGTQIPQTHVQALKALKTRERNNFFLEIRNHFILKSVFFNIDIKNYRFKVSDQFFPENDNFVSKNQFFLMIKKLFNTIMYSNVILEKYISGNVKLKEKDYINDSDFYLYS